MNVENRYEVTRDLVSPCQFLVACRQHLKMIILVTIAFGILGYGLSRYVITPEYRADTQVLIRTSSNKNGANNDLQGNQQLVGTYTDMATNSDLMSLVTNRLRVKGYQVNPNRLARMVKVHSNENSQILTIMVSADTPGKARTIANVLTDSLRRQSKELMRNSNLVIVATAKLPTRPFVYGSGFIVALLTLIGLVISLTWVLVRTYMHPVVSSGEALAEELNIVELGEIGRKRGLDGQNEL